MNPLAIPLPAAVRRHGEIAGLIAGIACFPFAFYAGSLEGVLPRGPAALVLPIVIMSAIVGAIASITVDSRKAPDMGGVPLRVGVRAGFVASLLGGAFAVLASTLHSFGLGSPSRAEVGWDALAILLPLAPAARVIVLALLALPPSIFFALIGALLAGMLASPPASNADASPSQAPPTRERSAVFTTAVVLTIVCYLSPFFVVFKPKPKPVPIATPRPLLATPIPASPPPPPKWRYQKPETFNNVEPSRITIAEQRGIGEVSQQQPVAMSPNGLRFAYFSRTQGKRLKVTDLETLDVIASAETAEEPATLAWSPDSRRIFFATEGERKSLIVFDVESSRLIFLPKPIDMRVPTGRPAWWDEQEILFAAGNPTPSVLSLDTLRVLPADGSPKWKALPDTKRNELKETVFSYLPGNPRWQMRVEGLVRRYDVPLGSSGKWTFSDSMNLALVSPQNAYRATLSGADVRLGDDLVASPDGSKIVRIRDGAATVFFLGLREQPASQFNITMPEAPDSALTDALSKNRVCAFVCAPLINPLNRKTVGPDREHVKAIARIVKWEETSARLWIDEEYSPVGTGDVVADLHTWETSRPKTAGTLGEEEWFAVIDTMDGSSHPPSQNEASPLDRELRLEVETKRGADRIERIVPTRVPTPVDDPRVHVAPSPPTLAPPPGATPTPSAPAPAAISNDLQRALLTFITEHHAKSSRSDVRGMVADFADRVEYMTHGYVGHDFIAKDLDDYHRTAVRVTDAIIGTPTLEARPDGDVDVTYLVAFRRDLPNGKWFKGLAEFASRLTMTANGPRIIVQHIKLRDQQKSP